MTRSLAVLIALLFLVGVFLFFPGRPRATEPRGEGAEAPAETKVKRWIEDLGSDRFEVREAATRALMELADEPSALRKSLKSPDREVRRRAASILKSYVPNRARRGLAKVLALAKEGRVDEMIERLVLWNEWDKGKERGKALAELAAHAIEWEYHNFEKTGFLSHSTMLSFPVHVPYTPPTHKELAELWTRFKEVRGTDIVDRYPGRPTSQTVLVASGNAHITMLDQGVIVANGDIQVGSAKEAVILSDGDVEVKEMSTDLLIIANGDVKCPTGTSSCTIIGGGSIMVPKEAKYRASAILNMGTPKCFIKFFAPETVGLTVWQLYEDGKAWPVSGRIVDQKRKPALGDGVWLKEVSKDSPFASGLRGGDVITALEDQKTPTTEIFRRVLRRKLAEGEPLLTFTVRRDGKTMEVPIAMKTDAPQK